MIVGGGAAGLAAADMLRREGYGGPLTMISADDSPPCDRPNLSKDFLAGTAQEDWIPLRPPESYYDDQRIDLGCSTRASPSLDLRHEAGPARRTARAAAFGALLLATGADPVQLAIPGRQRPSQVHYLRTFADSQAIVGAVGLGEAGGRGGRELHRARGGGVAARARHRGARGRARAAPLERVMGPEVGRFIRRLHEAHGVVVPPGRDGRPRRRDAW